MLQLIIIISLFCNGLHIITREGQIFYGLRTFIEDLLFTKLAAKIPVTAWYKDLPTFIYKPLMGCIKCMASFWGIVISLIVLYLNINLLWQIPIICISASALNAIFYQLYE